MRGAGIHYTPPAGTITTAMLDTATSSRLLTYLERSERVVPLALTHNGTSFQLIENTAYFVYIGRVVQAFTPKHVLFNVGAAGTGAQTAEVGLFSTPASPNRAAQSLTKLVASGTVDDLTTTGLKGNTTPFATSIPAGTYLWAGIRTAMATNEPQITGNIGDIALGNSLALAAAGALTDAGPWTGAIVSISSSHPGLRISLD